AAPPAAGRPKVEYVRAPAGGKVSEVDGKFYAGGRMMPVHGLYSGQERPPPGRGPAPTPGPAGEGGKPREPARPLTEEQGAERRRAAERRAPSDAIRRSPLADLVPLGQGEWARPYRTVPGHRDWMAYAGSVSDAALGKLAERLAPLADPQDVQDELEH